MHKNPAFRKEANRLTIHETILTWEEKEYHAKGLWKQKIVFRREKK
jgi:hypothetical protein